MPKVIVNDQHMKFMLEFWTSLMKKMGTKLKFNTTFHLLIDGQMERVNKILNQYLGIISSMVIRIRVTI